MKKAFQKQKISVRHFTSILLKHAFTDEKSLLLLLGKPFPIPSVKISDYYSARKNYKYIDQCRRNIEGDN